MGDRVQLSRLHALKVVPLPMPMSHRTVGVKPGTPTSSATDIANKLRSKGPHFLSQGVLPQVEALTRMVGTRWQDINEARGGLVSRAVEVR